MPATLTLSGRKFVVLSQDEYRSLKKKAGKSVPKISARSKRLPSQEAGDIAESKRRLKDPNRIPAAEVFNRLGV
jgi:hypothetical protein